MNIVRIVPAPLREGQPENGYRLTNGTKVILADGSELQGVMRVQIVGEPHSVWTAIIECACRPPEFEAIQAQIALTAAEPRDLDESEEQVPYAAVTVEVDCPTGTPKEEG